MWGVVAVSEQLRFNRVYEYDTRLVGISIPVRLQSGSVSVEVEARLDTGSSHCIFKRADAQLLGIDIDSGQPQVIRTVAGSFLTYAHEVNLVVLGVETTTAIYFAADEGFSRNVLGRKGWLDRVRLGLVDYDGKLYLSSYDDLT